MTYVEEMRKRSVSARRVVWLCVVLLATGCLEGFERMVTRVIYDPFEQVFHVERELINVDARFLDCETPDACLAALARVRDVVERGASERTPAERMARHLLDTGARDLSYALHQEGEALHVHVSYVAPLGSRAAGDTLVHVEHQKGRYRLVVDAQASMEKLKQRHKTRRLSQVGSGPLNWREEWVLPGGVRKVTVHQAVDVVDNPILGAVAGLEEAMAQGELWAAVFELGRGAPVAVDEAMSEPPPEPVPDVEDPVDAAPEPPEPEPEAPVVASAPAPVEEAEQEEVLPDESTAAAEAPPMDSPLPVDSTPLDAVPPQVQAPDELQPEAPEDRGSPFDPRALPAYAPDEAAQVFAHPPLVEGPTHDIGLTRALAEVTEYAGRCYQNRQAEATELAGHAFVEVEFAADGDIASSAIYGAIPDPPMLRCLEASADLAPWAGVPRVGTSVRIRLPLTFQVDSRRRKKRK